MFTGIITTTTDIVDSDKKSEGLLLTFGRPLDWTDLAEGESIATDGVCLTVAAIRANEYDCHLIPETLGRSTFGRVVPATVNLERSLKVNDRLSGHFVQGHVDDIGTVKNIHEADGWVIEIAYDRQHANLVVAKGSITVNGVALTVATDQNDSFSVALVPYTLEHTTLGQLKVGDQVNLEFDILGKYISKLAREAKHAKS